MALVHRIRFSRVPGYHWVHHCGLRSGLSHRRLAMALGDCNSYEYRKAECHLDALDAHAFDLDSASVMDVGAGYKFRVRNVVGIVSCPI